MISRFQYIAARPLKPMNEVQLQARQVLEKKIMNGTYRQEPITECLCGHDEFEDFAERERYGMQMQTVMCKNCGLLVQSPRLTEEALNLFYNQEYRSLYSPAYAQDPSLLFQTEEKLGQKVIRHLVSSVGDLPRSGSVLDIGCGAGGALEPFRQLGWRVQGCEVDQGLAGYGNQHSIPTHTESIDSEKYEKSSFDLVLLNDILEHQLRPDVFLGRVREVLKPGGWIYVQLPGIRHLKDNSYPDILRDLQLAHTFYWDLKLLEYLFNAIGFRKVSGTEEIRSIFQKTESVPAPHSASVNNYFHDMRQFLTSVEVQRFRLFWRNNYGLLTNNPVTFAREAILFTRNSW